MKALLPILPAGPTKKFRPKAAPRSSFQLRGCPPSASRSRRQTTMCLPRIVVRRALGRMMAVDWGCERMPYCSPSPRFILARPEGAVLGTVGLLQPPILQVLETRWSLSGRLRRAWRAPCLDDSAPRCQSERPDLQRRSSSGTSSPPRYPLRRCSRIAVDRFGFPPQVRSSRKSVQHRNSPRASLCIESSSTAHEQSTPRKRTY